jgi:DNA-binding ferritin-like protein
MKTEFKTSNSLSPGTRAKAGNLLNQMLATWSDLYSQAKQAH